MSEARTPPHEKPGAKSKLFAKYKRSLRREKAALRAALAARRGQEKALREAIEALRREKAALRAALAARRGQKDAMRKEEAALRREKESLLEANAALRREKALGGDVARLTAEIEHLRRMHARDGDTPAPPPSC